MYIEKVPNRNSPPAVLLRESYREEGKVKKRTVANLSKLPEDIIESMKLALKGAKLSINEAIDDNFEVVRSLPHGHVGLILETIYKLNLDNIISPKPSRNCNLITAMITARIINPASKLATARGFNEQTCSNSLGHLLGRKKAKVRTRFGIKNVVWVTDRGILTNSKINELVKSVDGDVMSSAETVIAYKNLSQVESAFRCYKSIDLKVRPIYHYKGDRVKAHIFLCMLAYYGEWHLKQALAPLLFKDEEIENKYQEIVRASRSESAQSKDRKNGMRKIFQYIVFGLYWKI